LDIGARGRGELRLRVHAFGFNRAEAMWHVFGAAEAAGGATGFRIGDKDSTIPAFSMNQYGIYGEQAIVPICARRGVHDLKHPIIVYVANGIERAAYDAAGGAGGFRETLLLQLSAAQPA
jgi:hypothetical protein